MVARKNAKKEIAEITQFSETMPAYMQNDTMRGSENVGSEDLTIPRLSLIQDLSPQRKKSEPEYIEGAEEGMYFNSVSSELYGDSVIFVPVFFAKEWNIWKMMDAGGGFAGSFDSEKAAQDKWNEEGYDPDEYEIVDTAQHFGLIVHEDHIEEIVISMAKSKMKVNRALNSMIRLNGGDRFSRAFKITSVVDENNVGQKYYNIKMSPLGFVSEEVYKKAEELYDSVASGIKTVSRETAED